MQTFFVTTKKFDFNLIVLLLTLGSGNSGSDLGNNSSRKGSNSSGLGAPDNNNESSRRGSRADAAAADRSSDGDSDGAPGAKNAHSKKEPFDADEDGYAIGEGKKHGKPGIAALKHRADSLTRLGQKDMDDAMDMNKNGMHAN